MRLPTEFNLREEDIVKQDLSEGFCMKWKKQVVVQGKPKTIWIKAGSYIWGGYEHDSLGEVIASQVAEDLQIKDVVRYKPCILNITESSGQQRRTIGCYSFDFTQPDEEVISLLHLLGYECDDAEYSIVMRDTLKRTELQPKEFDDYIKRVMTLDAVILNEDRRLGNLAVLKNKQTGKFRICPIFDNGQCFSLVGSRWNYDGIYNDFHVSNIKCKPFESMHDRQLEIVGVNKEALKEKQQRLGLNLNKTIALVNKLYEIFGYGFDESWSLEKRIEVQRLRKAVGEVDEPILLYERNFIIALLKRRFEIVMCGQTSTYQPKY